MKSAVLYGAKDIRIENVNQPDLLPGMVLLHIKRAGICGSDLHYYKDGYCGSFVPSKPFILGHELTAEIISVNTSAYNVDLPVGSRITVNPAMACGYCDYCENGKPNLCRNTIMLGSGSTNPPTNGAFAEYLSVRADQCYLLPDGMDDGIGAMIEPLSVAIHAVKQASNVVGKQVLITGGGTIGLLTALVVKVCGAATVALSDIVTEKRNIALKHKVDIVLNPADAQLLTQVKEITGDGFDVIFEASGATPALHQAFELIKPGGTIVQIGTLNKEDIALPANQIMIKEIKYIGSFRYGNVFEEAISLAASGKIDLSTFITGVFPLIDINKAMHLAADKTSSLKVQLEI